MHQDIYPSSDTLTFSDGVSQQFIILTILSQDGPEVEEEYIIYLAYSTGTLDAQRVNASVVIAGRGMPYGVVGLLLDWRNWCLRNQRYPLRLDWN